MDMNFELPSSPPTGYVFDHPSTSDNLLEFLSSFENSNDFAEFEDIFAKDTSTPPTETTLEEEHSLEDRGLIHKPIKKLPKNYQRSKTGNAEFEHQAPLTCQRTKREVKRPVHEYEEKRIEEDERKKNQQVKKSKSQMCDSQTKHKKGPKKVAQPIVESKYEASYKNRNCQIVFNEELKTLAPQQFIRFLKIVQEKHPECINFNNGRVELQIKAPQESKKEFDGNINELYQMQEGNMIYSIFLGYIEQIKR